MKMKKMAVEGFKITPEKVRKSIPGIVNEIVLTVSRSVFVLTSDLQQSSIFQ